MMRPILTLGLAALIASAQTLAPAQAEEAAAAESSESPIAESFPAITVAEVQPRLLSERIIATGLIAAVEEVQVVPLIEGQPLDALLADVGDWVEEGAVLARLSRSTLELQKTPDSTASSTSVVLAIAPEKPSMNSIS